MVTCSHHIQAPICALSKEGTSVSAAMAMAAAVAITAYARVGALVMNNFFFCPCHQKVQYLKTRITSDSSNLAIKVGRCFTH